MWKLWKKIIWLTLCIYLVSASLSVAQISPLWSHLLHTCSQAIVHSDVPKHLEIARGFNGTQEKGNNRGYWIDRFNRPYHNIGGPYCATGVAFWLDSAGAIYPKGSALARNYKKKDSKSALDVLYNRAKVNVGDIIVWQRGATIYGHAGIADTGWTNKKGLTVQANTGPPKAKGSAQWNGSGVYIKMAAIEPYNYFRIIAFTPVRYDD